MMKSIIYTIINLLNIVFITTTVCPENDVSAEYPTSYIPFAFSDNETTQTNKDNESLEAKAYNLYRQKQWDKAKNLFSIIVKEKPNDYHSRIYLGSIYGFLNEIDNAEIEFNNAIRINKNKYHSYFNLGMIHKEKNNQDKSIAYFKEADRLNPYDIRTLFQIGDIYYTQKKYEPALEYFNRVYAIDQTSIANAHKIGDCYHALGQFKEEAEIYNKILSSNPNYLTYFKLGLAMNAIGDKNAEIQAYIQALKFKPEDRNVTFNLALTHYESGNFDTAIDGFSKIKQSDDDLYGRALYFTALIFINKGDIQKGAKIYNTLKEIAPEQADQIYELLKQTEQQKN